MENEHSGEVKNADDRDDSKAQEVSESAERQHRVNEAPDHSLDFRLSQRTGHLEDDHSEESDHAGDTAGGAPQPLGGSATRAGGGFEIGSSPSAAPSTPKGGGGAMPHLQSALRISQSLLRSAMSNRSRSQGASAQRGSARKGAQQTGGGSDSGDLPKSNLGRIENSPFLGRTPHTSARDLSVAETVVRGNEPSNVLADLERQYEASFGEELSFQPLSEKFGDTQNQRRAGGDAQRGNFGQNRGPVENPQNRSHLAAGEAMMRGFMEELQSSMRELNTSMREIRSIKEEIIAEKREQRERSRYAGDVTNTLGGGAHERMEAERPRPADLVSGRDRPRQDFQRRRGLQSRDMPLSEFNGSANQSLEAWIRMARMKQAREGLSDGDIFAAAVFKLRGDAQTYYHLSESEFEHYTLDSLAKILRRRFDKGAVSIRALPELWKTKQREDESATSFEVRWKTAVERAKRAEPDLLTDELLFLVFQSAVNTTFQDRILDSKCETYQEAMEEFHSYGLRKEGDSGPKLPGVFAVNTWEPKKNLRPSAETTERSPPVSKGSDNRQRVVERATPRIREGISCYICSGPHYKSECPEMRRGGRQQERKQKHKRNTYERTNNNNSGRQFQKGGGQNFAGGGQQFTSFPPQHPSNTWVQGPPQMGWGGAYPPYMMGTPPPWAGPPWYHTPYGPVMGMLPHSMPVQMGQGGMNYATQYGPPVVMVHGGNTGFQYPASPPQHDAPAGRVVAENRRIQGPPSTSITIEREEAKDASGKDNKGTQAKVRAVSGTHPRLYIVRCEAGIGADTQSVLVDSCAPANLIDMGLVDSMKSRGLARATSTRNYSPDMVLVGISGKKLATGEEVEVDIALGGVSVTKNFIPVRDLADKVLLGTEFLDDLDADISFSKRAVVFNKIGVSLKMTGFWRRLKGSLPRAVVFCKEPIKIPPMSELPIKVVHLGSNPLSYVTREAYVCDRVEAVRPTSLSVCPAIVRFDRGEGTVLVSNVGDTALHLDRESAVADVMSVDEREEDLDLGQGKSMGVYRVNFSENHVDLESDKIQVLASLAIKPTKDDEHSEIKAQSF